ncbi:hypothetical protein [Anditalea andensis]|uniref:DUF4440 domain-containing protein n=1 Tax=Anditalea andensis TaxID=1048983 RepID=A0A074LF95_9BACT|nr:hypothetical protein [Anditalea andensis]KEO72457.1 hypothetical protein EL17_17100 [Anditalea andensis]
MFKQVFLVKLLILGCTFMAQAQLAEDIREAAQMYAQANLNEDYELLLDFTYPSVIEHAGGRDAYKKTLIQLNEIQKSRGMKLNEFIIKEPMEHVKAGNEYHAIVPYKMISQVKGGKLSSENTLIAVIAEGKDKWYFIETTSLTEKNLVKVLPTWDHTLTLPLKKAPIYQEDK